MEWFKHDTDASTDAKIRKLIMRHGAIGYAIYFHCLELIMADVNKDNITFQLEHDAEIIADNLKIQGNGMEAGVDIVNKIMMTIIDLNLFESTSNRITCLKLASRLDSSMTSNGAFRKAISELKCNCTALTAPSHDTIMTPSCLSHDTIMQEEEQEGEAVQYNNRSNLDKNIKEKNTKKENPYKPPYQDEPVRKLDKLITEGIEHWNSKGNLLTCKYNLFTLPKIGDITTKFDVYRDGEILQAIDNLSKAYDSLDQKYRPKNFQNFICNSLDNWFEERIIETKRTYRTGEERRYWESAIMIGGDDPEFIAQQKKICIDSLVAIGEEFIDYDKN